MYQYLNGKLVEKNPTSVVLEVHGVGYHIQVPLTTFAALGEPGEALKIWTHLVVREDAHLLFGFATEEERQMFRLLIGVSGIGPKSAMTVLSGTTLSDLKQAIIEGSLSFLTGISGVGRKTAERIIIEIREKLVVEDRKITSSKLTVSQTMIEDSIRALIELGYRKQNARQAVEKVLNQSGQALSVPELVRASLKHIG